MTIKTYTDGRTAARGYLRVMVLGAALMVLVAGAASAETVLLDDFEAYPVDKEPPKNAWSHMKGNAFDDNAPAMIVEDPRVPNRKVYSHTGQRLYASDLAFTNFTWEFDWMVDADSNTSVAWRIQEATQYYYFTRRRRGKILWIFRLNNNSTLLNEGFDEWPSEPNRWYTAQITADGAVYTVKIKPWDPLRRFANVAPIAEVEDPNYPEGPIGFWGANGGTLYIDNVHVYTGDRPNIFFDVEARGKAAVTWAAVKSR